VTGRLSRWRGGVGAAVLLATVGVVGQNGTLLFAAAIPLAYLVVASLSRSDPPEGLTATRRVEPQPARPGEAVTVALTVHNGSDRTLPDVRVADGVPGKIAVVAGSPRAASPLDPGEDLVAHYRVVARRGEHPFDPPQVRTRGLGAGTVTTVRPPTAGTDVLDCRLDADAPPLEDYGEGHVGTLTTDRPGRGLAFHSIREHRPDDPASRIDWRHYAKRGELATVNYERAIPATVVLVLDARAANHVVPSEGRPTAVERQAYAATRALTDLLGSGHDVGVAVLGLDGPGPAGLYWLPPACDPEQRSLALDLFRTATEADPPRPAAPEGPPVGPDATAQVRRLLDVAPQGAQMALFSPLLDHLPVSAVETWCDAGRPVTVVSANVVPDTTVSGQHAQVRRRTRLARCQAAGGLVLDWRRGTPLVLVVERAFDTEARVASTRARGGGA
jgi:uncharacterized protein (DUF58 family)